jgi:hypothetical protein
VPLFQRAGLAHDAAMTCRRAIIMRRSRLNHQLGNVEFERYRTSVLGLADRP